MVNSEFIMIDRCPRHLREATRNAFCISAFLYFTSLNLHIRRNDHSASWIVNHIFFFSLVEIYQLLQSNSNSHKDGQNAHANAYFYWSVECHAETLYACFECLWWWIYKNKRSYFVTFHTATNIFDFLIYCSIYPGFCCINTPIPIVQSCSSETCLIPKNRKCR